MRVLALIATLAAGLGLTAVTGATAAPAKGGLCKVVCAPAPQSKAKIIHIAPAYTKAVRVRSPRVKSARVKSLRNRAHMRHAAYDDLRHHARRHDYYSYREAENLREERRDYWHGAPNDGAFPPPPPPPPYAGSQDYYAEGYAQDYQRSGPCNCGPGLEIDRYGWTGGVGYAASAEPFVDGYGMVHYASGSFQNGPTYNSYRQSFQANPSRPGPFQPRVMGGFAPGGPHMGAGGFGPHR
jgi:hypothetical protein